MYKVEVFFNDLQDGGYEYHPGDTFPRRGMNVSDDRIAELSGKDNRLGTPIIKKVEEKTRSRRSTAE